MNGCRHLKPPQVVFQLIFKRMVDWVDRWNVNFWAIWNSKKSLNSGKRNPKNMQKPLF